MDRCIDLNGVSVFPGILSPDAQHQMVEDVRAIARAAPLFHPVTARGKPLSVRMTSAGAYGWISDRRGYRYEVNHPNGQAWPMIPDSVLRVWDRVSGVSEPPESCLVNFYDGAAKMGLHQDRDEARFDMPVVSISLGDAALFRVGGQTRGGKTQSIWLNSGDVAVLSGSGRLAYHGVDRIKPGSSRLLPNGGRINLTLRVVT